jgi:predicted signal transduction protein with EAL and GGDEF domain
MKKSVKRRVPLGAAVAMFAVGGSLAVVPQAQAAENLNVKLICQHNIVLIKQQIQDTKEKVAWARAQGESAEVAKLLKRERDQVHRLYTLKTLKAKKKFRACALVL